MAEILPIRAWRYAPRFLPKMEELIAPLFDVVSERQRDLLYQNPLNSIHLAVPSGIRPAQEAKARMEKWKKEQVLVQDSKPGIYVYYQYFRLPGEHHERCRKGFMAHIKAYDWDEKVILRHENTIVNAVNDRIDLLKATQIQASPTHGLYEDKLEQLEPYMDEAIAQPIYDLEDYQGVREVMAIIDDPSIISKFLKVLAGKNIILADGHHRLEGSIAYRNSKKPEAEGGIWKGFDYHLMYLTNTSGNHLKILPTHRLFYGLKISAEHLIQELQQWFLVKKFADPEELGAYAFHKPHTFGLVIGEESFMLQAREEKLVKINQNLPEIVRTLDLTVLHRILFAEILDIPVARQRSSDQIAYERNFARCIQEVRSGKASFAMITRELELDQVMQVCKSGELMPQKSTYFYPKALGGLLFASIKQEEFEFDYGSFFK
ncbi:DUF1015 domain-containing protein [Algoriphagus halophytocola]|uniref:DUF1015 domain-containing protein n=1 Tax=Algoriphagus halophytocola TaxID=2991499 RepID=A0ABY6MJ04_9BACT|nr:MULTISPECIES: DUF1015 domain-containing protein [unclassified Algoriphagus]UZD23143.1 DUF1015 domain-containing protein [Algoriphagus sp. TR-M5]WBL44435.1 DUF1015 domain-containing protein [Algoriphagus sp. TR-M9]